MSDPGQPRRPGLDEIVLSAPGAGDLCHALTHRRAGIAALVVVTFGELGVKWQRDALWQDAWGRSYAMCGGCWEETRQEAQQARPALVIHDTTTPPIATSPGTGQ
jgi:hypothetical protein